MWDMIYAGRGNSMNVGERTHSSISSVRTTSQPHTTVKPVPYTLGRCLLISQVLKLGPEFLNT